MLRPILTYSRNTQLQEGFSLLEAIVALLLVTMLSITCFTWVSNLLLSVNKIEKNTYANLVQRNVTEFLTDINIMLQPEGEQDLGGINVLWTATPIEPVRRGKNMAGGDTPFEIGLYKVNVQVKDITGKSTKFELIQVGYKALPDNVF